MDLPRARHRLYALLGELLAKGAVPEAVAIARRLPGLDGFDAPLDALAAGHQAAVVGSAPWASVWLSPEGSVGGAEADAARARQAAAGFAPTVREEPDHLGVELALLAHLCAVEAEQPIEEVRVLQAEVAGHLAGWAPAFAAAVARHGEPAWSSVVSLLCEALGTHGAAASVTLAGRLPDLDDPEVGLGRIARALATPACSGWWPTGPALDAIGIAAGVPSGFGDRAHRIRGMLEAAPGPAARAMRAELAGWDPGAPAFRARARETAGFLADFASRAVGSRG